MFTQRSIPPLTFSDPGEAVFTPDPQQFPLDEEQSTDWDLPSPHPSHRRLSQLTSYARLGTVADTLPGTLPSTVPIRSLQTLDPISSPFTPQPFATQTQPVSQPQPMAPQSEDQGQGQGYVHSAETVVRLERVTKRFPNGNCVLNQVDLQVQRGEFVFITGVSGAGKSTLLRLLYGADQATEGQVIVNDVELNRIRPRPLALLRRQLGVVFQDYRLLTNRTVNENVGFVLRAQGLSPAEIRRRLGPTLKMVGLVNKADRFPHELSGGEQQRLSLARAIVSTPVLLLADEPTGNLDRENSLLVLQILQRLNSFGVTIIMTTHDPYLWERSQHRMLQVDSGQIQELR